MSNTSALISGLVALSVTVAVMPAVLALLRRHQVLDVPSGRSLHHTPTPRGGGLALAIGCLSALVLAPAAGANERLALGGAAVAFGEIGLADDLLGVEPLRRLAGQALAAAVGLPLLLAGVHGPVVWQVLFGAGVLLWITAYVNAFNFMDGINGLSAAEGTLAGAAWCLLGLWQDVPALVVAGAILAGACVGFAPFNFPNARVFPGDIGTYFVGAWMAVTVVIGLRAGLAPEALVFPLAISLVDTSSTIARRLRRGERWYEAHRQHAYQRLCAAGWSHARTTATVSGFVALLIGLGFVAESGLEPARVLGDALALALVGAYSAAPRLASRRATTGMA